MLWTVMFWSGIAIGALLFLYAAIVTLVLIAMYDEQVKKEIAQSTDEFTAD